MIAVVSCKKYINRTVKLIDFGKDAKSIEKCVDRVKTIVQGECVVCGPMSHVEIGGWLHWYDVHEVFEHQRDAEVYVRAMDPVRYDISRYTKEPVS